MRLSFSEQPQASLSEITVLGPGGGAEQRGGVHPAAGDPLALEVDLPPLRRGVYTVSWKIVSAVDGHATEGTFAFGVRASPSGGTATESASSSQTSSRFELLARWALLIGIVALIGGATAGAARFAGSTGSDLTLAAAGWAASAVGLLLLGDAQRVTAGSSLGALLDTPVGHALLWRGAGLGVAGLALFVAWRAPRRYRRPALGVAALGALGVIVAHVDAGHAAAGNWSTLLTVSTQVAHFAAAGVWFGGLAALLLGVRGEPGAEKAAAVRRFSALALAALLVVFATGTLRAVDELGSWDDLVDTGYGRAVLAKLVLIGLIVAIAARNRRDSVPAAPRDLDPLRRRSRLELGLALVALFVAALLGTLAPPVSGEGGLPVLSASGADFGTTTRVELVTASDQPGANRFEARVEDYDSGDPLEAEAVSLRFTPLEDPGVEPSTLKLSPGPDGTFAGSGPNLAFDGRWRVDAQVTTPGGATVEVPLELDVPAPRQLVSVLRVPGRAPKFTIQIGSEGDIRIVPVPERAGPSTVYVTVFTFLGLVPPVDQLVLTTTVPGEPARQQAVRRLSSGRFVADVDLPAGPLEVAVTARIRDGSRMRAVFHLNVPE